MKKIINNLTVKGVEFFTETIEEKRIGKRAGLSVLAVFTVLALMLAPVSTAKVDLFVNNSQVHPDSPAYISSTNRTMVPISFVSQAFGFNTTWDGKKQEVTIKADGTTVVLTIGSKYATINGQRVEVDPGKGTAPVIRNSRTMVPVSFIASSFGVEVKWTAYPGSGGRVNFISKDFTPPVVDPSPSIPSTPTGRLNDAQARYVVDKMNASVSSGTGFEANVAKFTERQREFYVEDFIKDMKPPTGIQWLVSPETVHEPGIPCIAGLEIKTENGVKYQRVFNIPVNYENRKLINTAPFEYRTNWERIN